VAADRFAQLQRFLENELARIGVPGAALGVLDRGVAATSGLGVESIETGHPVASDTLFQIGSISKVFCTTLLMTLVDEDRVELDAPVSRYLPDVTLPKEAGDAVTVRMLVTHVSGIWGDLFDDFGWGDDALGRALERIGALPQIFPPGTQWSYCNVAFHLVGALVERLTKQTFEEAMGERVLAPLGLERTRYLPHEVFSYPHAVGHVDTAPAGGEVQVARDYWLSRALNAAGGLLSTAEDLLAFARFHLGDGSAGDWRVLRPETLAAMRRPQVRAGGWADSWGLGWDVRTRDGRAVLVGHGGQTNGYVARLTLAPEEDFAFVVLTNSSRGFALYPGVEHRALELYRPGLAPRPRERVRLAPERLARLAGDYRNPDAELRVTLSAGGLRLERRVRGLVAPREIAELPPLELAPVGEFSFEPLDEAERWSTVDFVVDGEAGPRFVRYAGRLATRAP
jgi:CubicO group peptidase (beta-lactamase class C family)